MKDRIKQLRKSLGLTQQKFAERIGIRQNTIAMYETGINTPADTVVNLICREYRVNENWLRTGEGDMFLPESQDALDAFAEQYHLSTRDKAMFRLLAVQTPEFREELWNFCNSASGVLN